MDILDQDQVKTKIYLEGPRPTNMTAKNKRSTPALSVVRDTDENDVIIISMANFQIWTSNIHLRRDLSHGCAFRFPPGMNSKDAILFTVNVMTIRIFSTLIGNCRGRVWLVPQKYIKKYGRDDIQKLVSTHKMAQQTNPQQYQSDNRNGNPHT